VTLGAVILAAGAGTRLGGVAKALLPCGERTFLARITATAAAAGIAPDAIVVVVGAPFAGAVAAHAAELGPHDRREPGADPRHGQLGGVWVRGPAGRDRRRVPVAGRSSAGDARDLGRARGARRRGADLGRARRSPRRWCRGPTSRRW
jgi:hypothetical protein